MNNEYALIYNVVTKYKSASFGIIQNAIFAQIGRISCLLTSYNSSLSTLRKIAALDLFSPLQDLSLIHI